MSGNALTFLLNKYPDKNWDWFELSKNSNITKEFIDNNLHFPWDWKLGVSSNRNVDIEFIEKHNNKKWSWLLLSKHIKFNQQTLIKYKDKLNFCKLSLNPNLTLDLVLDNNDLHWNYHNLLLNPIMTVDFFLKYEKKLFNNIYFPTNLLSMNPEITINELNRINIIKRLSWNWDLISKYNKNITFDYYENHICKELFSLKYLSKKKNITMKIIEDNPSIQWDWKYISINPNINIDFITKNDDKFIYLNWLELSKNKGITIKDIDNYNYSWNWNGISMNPNITIDFIQKNINLIGNDDTIYDLINFKYLSKNTFECINKKIMKIKMKLRKRKVKRMSKEFINNQTYDFI